jgi:orotate phosphoribosyltransferase
MNQEEEIAKILLSERAVFLRPEEPFTWTSGIKSPVYCDNRLLISTVISREVIIKSFVDYVKPLNIDLVAGTATAGIPWAAWIAQALQLPLVYVRSSGKEHGRQNAIEGAVKEGQKAVLIEDLVSTGKSSIAAAKKLQEAKVEITSVVSIFSYQFADTEKIFKENNLHFHSLSNFEILSKVAYDNKMLNSEALKQVLEWKESVTFL